MPYMRQELYRSLLSISLYSRGGKNKQSQMLTCGMKERKALLGNEK